MLFSQHDLDLRIIRLMEKIKNLNVCRIKNNIENIKKNI